MANGAAWMARKLSDLERKVDAVSRGPRLGNSSLDSSSIPVYDEDGNIRLRFGAQDDGTHALKYVQGPPPPAPLAPVVSVDGPVIRVRFVGLDGAVPEDFHRVEVHLAGPSGDILSEDSVAASMVARYQDEAVLMATETGQHQVALVAVSMSSAKSALSPVVTADVELVNLKGALDAVVDNAQGGSNHYAPTPPSGTDHGPNDLWFDTSVDPDTGLTSYTAHRWDSEAQEWVSLEDERVAALEEAQRTIENVADAALQAATHNAKNLWSTAKPNGTAPRGTIWFQIDGTTKNVIGQWQQTAGSDTAFGSNWEPRQLTDALFDNIDAGKINTGYLDVAALIRAGAIKADKLLIGGALNLIPGVVPGTNRGLSSFTWDAAEDALRFDGRGTVYADEDITLPPGTYSVEADIKASVTGTRTYLGVLGRDDTTIQYRYGISNVEVGTEWAHYSATLTIAEGEQGTFAVRFLPAYGGDASATTWYRNVSIRPQIGSTLIEPGAITTGHILAGAVTAESGIISSIDAGTITVGFMNGARVEAGTIDTEQLAFGAATGDILKADALDGKVITGTVVQTARSGARVVLGEDGLSVYDAADDWRVRLTPSGSMFRGDMEAESLVATGPAELRHGGNILAPAAELSLAAGVGDPTGPPVVQPFWQVIDFGLPWTPAGRVEFTGLAFDGKSFWTSAREWTSDGKSVNRHERLRIDPATGAVTRAASSVGLLQEPFGVACVGDRLYWLVEGTRDYQIVVEVTDLTGKYVTMWEDGEVGWSPKNPLGYKPGIGTSPYRGLIISQCTDAGSLTWRTYSTSGELLTTVDCKDSTRSGIAGVYYGPADWPGSTNITVLKASTRSFETFDQSGSWQNSMGWQTAERQNESGLCYAGGGFHAIVQAALPGGRGRITRYASAEMGGGEDWWAAYRWAHDTNGDGTADHLSRISPPRNFSWPARSQLKVLGAPLPDGVSSIAPVLAKKTAKPVRADFRTPAWKSTPGLSEAVYESLPKGWGQTAAPGDVNTFPDAAPAVMRSANRNIELRGDGSGRWGPLTFHRDGSMTGIPKIASGYVVMDRQVAGETTSMVVTLPVGLFSSAPSVLVTPSTSVPYTTVRGVSAGGATADSFTLYVNRTNTTNTGVAWMAIERTN